MAQLRYSLFSISPKPLENPHITNSTFLLLSPPSSPSLLRTRAAAAASSSAPLSFPPSDPPNKNNNGRGRFGGGGNDDDDDKNRVPKSNLPLIGSFIDGWRSRVVADPQFPFKVLMEELVGVSACVLGDMASRPNFGLNELDSVFSTLVVGAIVNFVLMYLLAPTATLSSGPPLIFPNSPRSHMFQPGNFSLFDRMGTFVCKGVAFAAVGFVAGLVGTAISNGLVEARKKMDPGSESPNKGPPTILNAATWAVHMGLSSNLRYQTLNGVEFVLEKGLPEVGFKVAVVALRCLNNVLGGVSFVALARITGSQKVEEAEKLVRVEEKEKLVRGGDSGEEEELQSSQSQCK